MKNRNTITLTGETMDRLARDLVDRAAKATDQRLILGIAGIPGSGKSTLAWRFAKLINNIKPLSVALAPMDGFHLSNAVLKERGLIERKGAPETFDIAGYLQLLADCRDAANVFQCPRYDRTVHEPVRDGDPLYVVDHETRIVITEGNYLLLNEPPWSELAQILTVTWWLDTPAQTARRWIMARHAAVGRSNEEAEDRYANDLANTRLILNNLRPADCIVNWPDFC